MPEPSVMITQYTINAIPDPDSVWADSFAIEVEYRGRGLWAVCRHKRCFDRDGNADWEPRPSDREDEWLARFRFTDVAEAIEVAKKVAPEIVANGRNAAQAWELEMQQSAAREVTR